MNARALARYEDEVELPHTLEHTTKQIIANDNQKFYKAYFRHVTKHDKEEFKNSKCILPISVGRDYHEGGQLKATLALLNKSFSGCTVLICDTLQRYSLGIIDSRKTEKELFDLAFSNGQKWLGRNRMQLAQLAIPHSVSRWNDFLGHSAFSKHMALVNQLYENDVEYRETTNLVANEFIERSETRRLSKHHIFSAVIKYLLEESAVSCMWINDGYNFDVYPTGDNRAMTMSYEKLIEPKGLKYKSLPLNIKKMKTAL